MTDISNLTMRAKYERGLFTLEEVEADEGVSEWSREQRSLLDRRNNLEHLRQLRAVRRQDPTRAAHIEGPLWGGVEDYPERLRLAVIKDDSTPMNRGGRGIYDVMSFEYHGLMALTALANGDIEWADLEDADEAREAARTQRIGGVAPPSERNITGHDVLLEDEGESFGPVVNPDGTPTAFTKAMLTGDRSPR